MGATLRCGPEPKRELALTMDFAFGILGDTVPSRIPGRPIRLLANRRPCRPPASARSGRLQPATWLHTVADRGATYRVEARNDLDAYSTCCFRLLSEMLRHVDVAELLQENVDVVALAEEVIAEIDLPEIIRESTGSMASDTLRGVRMQTISADDAVGRAVDRLRLRRTRRNGVATTAEPGPPPGACLMNGALSVVPSEARAYQGRPAGLVTRLLANTIDALCVVAAVLAGYAGFNALLFMLRPRNFEFVGSSVLMSLVVASAVAAVYLTVAWWITGRTYGDHLMGLRVVGPGGRRVGCCCRWLVPRSASQCRSGCCGAQ